MSGPTLLYPIASGLLSKKPVPGINDPALVLASDYDRDTQALKERLSDRALDQMRQLEELIECQTERDELRVQIEVMRELLRKVAPHFAAPPGLGYLHADIDAALQAEQ